MAFPDPKVQLCILKILFDVYPQPMPPDHFSDVIQQFSNEANKEVAYLLDKKLIKIDKLKSGVPINVNLTAKGVDFYQEGLKKVKADK